MKVAAAVVILLLASAPSRADWQYTTWGMSPEEVCAASHGDVSLKSPSAKELKSSERLANLASGTYTAGKFKFFALFYFEKKERKLEKVELLYTANPQQPPMSELLQALQEKHGLWSPGTVWIDAADNYALTYKADYNIGFLTYQPLHGEERKGL